MPETEDRYSNLRGFYTPPGYRTEKFARDSKAALSQASNYEHSKHPETGIHEDAVYAVAEDDIKDPDIWAHEFRHRADPEMSEGENRLWVVHRLV